MSLQKVVLLGEGGVGKSALTIQFTQNHFIRDYDPTIENSYRKQINLDNEVVMLDILDTAGQEEYSVMRDQYIRTGGGFLLVYSVANKETFSALDDFRDQILRVKDENSFPMILIGNKCDLADQRQVSTEEGKNMAKRWGCSFFETSAKTRINIEECFEQLVREMKHRSKNVTVAPAGGLAKKPKRWASGKSLRELRHKLNCVVS